MFTFLCENRRTYRNEIIVQLFRRLSLQIGRSILIRTLELKIGNPRTLGDLFIGERTPGPGFLSSFRSLDASSVLSRIQFGHCPWFYLQRGITIAVVYGWTALDGRGTGRRPLALILYRTLYPRSLPRPVSSSRDHRPHHRRPSLNPWTSRNFQFFRVPWGKQFARGRVVLPRYYPEAGISGSGTAIVREGKRNICN